MTAVDDAETRNAAGKDEKRGVLRFLPIALIGTGAVLALVLARDYLSFSTLSENREALIAWRDDHFAATVAVYLAIYVVSVAFSVPGAVWLTITAGFLFGTVLATSLTVVAATIGATLIFLAARTSLGSLLREKAGPWLKRVERGFQDGEISFLLIMRLVPAVPFFVANLAPAFLGARLSTFVWTTLVGIIPGTAVYASVGAGLGAVLDRGDQPDLGIIFSLPVLGPLLGLSALAALPLVIRKLRGRQV